MLYKAFLFLSMRLFWGLFLSFIPFVSNAFEPFLVEKIAIQGAVGLPQATIENYIPFKAGRELTPATADTILESLFKTYFFEDLQLMRLGQTLIVKVQEHPIIGKIEIKGNKTIRTDDLLKSLKELGLAEGHFYQAALLDKVHKDLEHQFAAIGKYHLELDVAVLPLSDHRVQINIHMKEGPDLRIGSIHIVGAQAFSESVLLEKMTLGSGHFWSFWTKNDRYTVSKRDKDLENLRDFYQDKGYLQMQVSAYDLALSLDKKTVDWTIYIQEGPLYHIDTVQASGEWPLPLTEITPLITIQPGDRPSMPVLKKIISRMQQRLGQEGYAFAQIWPEMQMQPEQKTVNIQFRCEAGRRIVARFVRFFGHNNTDDRVLRREMLQLEGAPLSTSALETSRVRLNRTGFFQNITIDPVPVPDSEHQVDVDVHLEEVHAGQFGGSMGFSSEEGLVFGVNVHHRNFLGTGNMVGFKFQKSKSFTDYSISYDNPYYTADGVSRGFNFFYTETQLSRTSDVSAYVTDQEGANVQYGFPLTPLLRLSMGYGVLRTVLKVGNLSTASIQLQEIMAGQMQRRYDEFSVFSGLTYNTFDRFIFPKKGHQLQLDVNTALIGSQHYYGIGCRYQHYYPIHPLGFIFMHQMHGAYGDGFAGHPFPLYKHYYAGGARSVRGFYEHSLGPKDSYGKSFGGNLLFTQTLSLILPPLFTDTESPSTRWQLFVDMGQVWDRNKTVGVLEAQGLRFSTGIAFSWLSPMGPLNFNLAKPLGSYTSRYQAANGQEYVMRDNTEVFSFGVGTSF